MYHFGPKMMVLGKGSSRGSGENPTKMKFDNCMAKKRTGIFVAETKFNQSKVTMRGLLKRE